MATNVVAAIRSIPVRREALVIAAFAVIAIYLLVAIFADWLSPYDFDAIDLRGRNLPPVGFGGKMAHFFGTDELGRDLLSRLIVSVRVSLAIAVAASLISLVIGVSLGLASALRGGIFDIVIRVAVDFHAALPFLMFALAVLAFFGNNLVLFVCLLGLHGWQRYARLVRAVALAEYQKGYVAALRRLGASEWRVSILHVLRNIAAVIVINWTISLPEIMLVESSLSFLGLGIQPPLSSLGNMVGLGRDYIVTSWWIATIPGIAIFLIALAISMVGDWLRDFTDPGLR